MHTARLLGFELHVSALPFQQQEQAVGACATAALWSALARAARASGARAPTPFSVTLAATKHLVTDRDFPATGGLELSQITGAIRELGLTPYTVKPRDPDLHLFMLTLKTYLRSGVPAVLMLQELDGPEYHAVAVAGFRCPPDAPEVFVEAREMKAVSRGMTRIYVHDDRVGPYVRMTLDGQSKLGLPVLRRVPVDQDKESAHDPSSEISVAIFPLYPKLRLTAPELIGLAGQLLPLLRQLVGAERRDELRFECWFALNGDYLRELYELGVQPAERIVEFLETTVLSRYVGVIRWYLGDEALADVLCDTTDIARAVPPYGAVLAIIMFPASLVPECKKYAQEFMPRATIV